MNLTGVLSVLLDDPAVREAVDLAGTVVRGEVDVVIPVGARPPLVAAMAQALEQAGAPLVVVTATGREADDLALALRSYVEADRVAVLPAWETLPHERLSPRSDTVARRLAVFRRLAHPEDALHRGPIGVLVVPVRALLQPVATGLGDLVPVAVGPGDRVDLVDLAERLVAAAYTRVDMVERRGEFAVRGGILDVFPPTEEHPLRLELWGDTVEEIRWFAVADQRSLEAAPGLWARRAGRSCSPTPSGPARRTCGTACPVPRRCSTRSRAASPSRAWSPSPRSSWTRWCPCSTCCPPGRWSS